MQLKSKSALVSILCSLVLIKSALAAHCDGLLHDL